MPYEKFLRHFSDHARYRHLIKIYTDYLLPLDLEIIHWYRALAKPRCSIRWRPHSIGKLSRPSVRRTSRRFGSWKKSPPRRNKADSTIFSTVTGVPLAYLDVPGGNTHSLTPGMAFDEFAPGAEAGVSFYTLSLDLACKKKSSEPSEIFPGRSR